MKNLTLIAVSLFTILFFSSCEKKHSEPLTSLSADNKLEITIKASRLMSVDPWLVQIAVQQIGNDKQIAEVSQEIMADEISSNNVKFTWNSNTSCLIKITQADGTVSQIPVSVEL